MVKIEKINLSDLKKTENQYDLFLCSSSFEDRCLIVASYIHQKQFSSVLICHFSENYSKSEDNLKKLQGLFHLESEIIPLSKSKPLANYDALFDVFSQKSSKNVLFDISTFTRENLLIILQLFRQKPFKDINLTLCYNPSDKYSNFIKGGYENVWLSKGVQNIRSIVGYSGDFSPIKELMLIVLVGFEAERAQILINNFEPDKLYIGKASIINSQNADLAATNQYNFDKLIAFNSNSIDFNFSCVDIDITKRELATIIKANMDRYNIVVSPMNNKLSTLAVASMAFQFPEVQICYAVTNQYNVEAYSSPMNFVYMVQADDLYNC